MALTNGSSLLKFVVELLKPVLKAVVTGQDVCLHVLQVLLFRSSVLVLRVEPAPDGICRAIRRSRRSRQ